MKGNIFKASYILGLGYGDKEQIKFYKYLIMSVYPKIHIKIHAKCKIPNIYLTNNVHFNTETLP
jgi:hypothetical protein